eukprot:652954_1
MSVQVTKVIMADQYQLQDDTEQKYKDDAQTPSDDPLLDQLPQELRKYVKGPQDHEHVELRFENELRTPCASCLHCTVSWLTLGCCCSCRLIKQGQIGLTQCGDAPQLLGPGRHTLLNPANKWVEVCDYRKAVINHGPLKIIRVQMGQLGYGMDMDDGKPMLLSRGEHVINKISFVWGRFVNFREPTTELGQLQVIRIETGKIGWASKQGYLKILEPGLHLVEPPDQFGGIISTQMQILELPKGVHETSDYVELAIKAAVFYRIVDAKKALLRIRNIKQQITETAVATIAGIIRASSLSDLGTRSEVATNVTYAKPMDDKEEKKEADVTLTSETYDEPTPFFQHVHDEFIQQLHDHVLDHVHDEFIQQLHDHVLDEWGIEIQNLRIESLKIHDAHLQKSIANQAIEVSKQHNKYLMLQKKSEIVMVEANAKAEKTKIETDAKARTIRSKAQADADAVIIAAEAQKQSVQLKGQAEAEYARLLESTKLGNAMSTMKIQSNALKDLDQIAYIPYLPNILAENVGVFAGNNAKQDFVE